MLFRFLPQHSFPTRARKWFSTFLVFDSIIFPRKSFSFQDFSIFMKFYQKNKWKTVTGALCGYLVIAIKTTNIFHSSKRNCVSTNNIVNCHKVSSCTRVEFFTENWGRKVTLRGSCYRVYNYWGLRPSSKILCKCIIIIK